MDIFPAIDIKNGRCVRLTQGVKELEKVYDQDPVSVAKRWYSEGARFLHVVDLDGAFEGLPMNFDIAQKAAKGVKVFSQLGGGIRSLETIEKVLLAGFHRAVVGTRAFEDEVFIEMALEEFGSRLAIGLDAKDGQVAVKGWTEITKLDAIKMALNFQKMGAKTFIYTDIMTDGMLRGPNFAAIEKLVDSLKAGVIASGGISSKEDILALKKLEYKGLTGVIVGKALYEGRVVLKEII